jgi:hypothetical protein
VYCSEEFLSHRSAPGTLKLIMSDGFSFGNSWVLFSNGFGRKDD